MIAIETVPCTTDVITFMSLVHMLRRLHAVRDMVCQSGLLSCNRLRAAFWSRASRHTGLQDVPRLSSARAVRMGCLTRSASRCTWVGASVANRCHKAATQRGRRLARGRTLTPCARNSAALLQSYGRASLLLEHHVAGVVRLHERVLDVVHAVAIELLAAAQVRLRVGDAVAVLGELIEHVSAGSGGFGRFNTLQARILPWSCQST